MVPLSMAAPDRLTLAASPDAPPLTVPIQNLMPRVPTVGQKVKILEEAKDVMIRGRMGTLTGINTAAASGSSDGVVQLNAFEFKTLPLSLLTPYFDEGLPYPST